MELWTALKNAFINYVKFEGRTARREYWMFILASVIVSSVLGAISNDLGRAWAAASLVPSLAAGARRLRDAGYSPWDLLWFLLPLVGWAIAIYRLAQPAKPQN